MEKPTDLNNEEQKEVQTEQTAENSSVQAEEPKKEIELEPRHPLVRVLSLLLFSGLIQIPDIF